MTKISRLFPLVLVTACAGKAQDSTGVGNPGFTSTEQALYEDGDESRRASDVASAIAAVPHLALAAPKDTAAAAATAGELGRAAFSPTTCVTTARAVNVVTFTFTNCTYLLGYGKVSGELQATYEAGPSPGSIAIQVASKRPFTLEAYNRDLEPVVVDLALTAQVAVQFTGDTKIVDWSGDYSATGPSFSITHQPSYRSTRTTADAESCVTLDGQALTTVNGRALTTRVTAYRRCGPARACPDAGGKVNFTRGDGRFVTVEFQGGRNTLVTLPDRSFETDQLVKCSG